MPRDTTLDCLLASFENMLVACEGGDGEAKAAAVAEFKKWLKEAVTACSAEEHATVTKLTSPPSPEDLRQVAQKLYEAEPIRYGGKYGDGDFTMAFDDLTDEAKAKCIKYASTAITAWQGLFLGVERNGNQEPEGAEGGVNADS